MPSTPDTDTLLSRLLAKRSIAAAIFALLAVGMTFPLAWNFATAIPFGAADIFQNYWNFWWWEKSLRELGQHPYHSAWLFFPFGTDLIFHTHSSFNMLAAMPFTAAYGPAAAYNFCVLLALFLSGFGAYWLVLELTGDSRGALLGGLVYAYFPQHIEQTLEHLNLFSIQFIPIALLFFVRLGRDGGQRNILGLGGAFALNTLCSWHLGLKLLLTLLAFTLYRLWRPLRSRRLFLRDLAMAGAVAALITLPFVAPLIAEMLEGADYYRKPAVERGIDPFFLLIPGYGHPLFGPLLADVYADRAYKAAGFLSYLGLVPVLLAALALLRRPSWSLPWAVYGLGATVMALGAHTYWNGTLIESVALPFGLLNYIPILGLMNVANRFLILTSLALAVLVGLGWTTLRKRTDARFALLAGLIVFEFLWLPYPVQEVEFSPLLSKIAASPTRGAVLDIPFNQRGLSVPNMMAQTVHNRPIGDGYLSTIPPEPMEAIENDPVLSDLAGVPKIEKPIDCGHLRELGFGFVVMHKERTDGHLEVMLEKIPPEQLYERKLVERMGGIPDETFAKVREVLANGCGLSFEEDEEYVVFNLTSGSR